MGRHIHSDDQTNIHKTDDGFVYNETGQSVDMTGTAVSGAKYVSRGTSWSVWRLAHRLQDGRVVAAHRTVFAGNVSTWVDQDPDGALITPTGWDGLDDDGWEAFEAWRQQHLKK